MNPVEVALRHYVDPALVKPEHILVDVGAAVGTFTEALAAMFPNNPIIAIEPSERCCEIIKSKQLQNVAVENAYLAMPREKEVTFFDYIDGPKKMHWEHSHVMGDKEPEPGYTFKVTRVKPFCVSQICGAGYVKMSVPTNRTLEILPLIIAEQFSIEVDRDHMEEAIGRVGELTSGWIEYDINVIGKDLYGRRK